MDGPGVPRPDSGEQGTRTRGDRSARRGREARPARPWLMVLAVAALALSACSLHVSKNGVSGNILGHSFSAAKGALPSGFPSAVPVPGDSRVLAGGGSSDRWDVAFAVKGALITGTASYRDRFTAAGFTVTDVQSGSTPVTAGTADPAATTTTVTLSGSAFRATDAQWTVEVASGTTTSSTDGTLRAGEFAVNITVVPTSSTTTPSTATSP